MPDDQGVDVMRAFVGVNGLEIYEMPNHGIAISDAHRVEDVARVARAFERHPDIIAFRERNLRGTHLAQSPDCVELRTFPLVDLLDPAVWRHDCAQPVDSAISF